MTVALPETNAEWVKYHLDRVHEFGFALAGMRAGWIKADVAKIAWWEKYLRREERLLKEAREDLLKEQA